MAKGKDQQPMEEEPYRESVKEETPYHLTKGEVLLRVWEQLRTESQMHRASIREALGWWIAGVLVVVGGVLAIDERSWLSSALVVFLVGAVSISFIRHIQYQRKKSEEAMSKMRGIEKALRFYEPNLYLAESPLLEPSWGKTPHLSHGLTTGDWLAIAVPGVLSLVAIALTFILQSAVPAQPPAAY